MGRKMKDSGVEWIGEIPENWKIGKIGQLYKERNKKVSDYDYAPLSVTMHGVVPQLQTAAKTDAHDSRKLVCKGDFAINSRSDRRGSCGISNYDGSVSLINTVLQPKDNMSPTYYNWLFHTSMFADEFYKWGHGIVDDLWTTNWSEMKNICIPIPSLKEQEKIANIVAENMETIDSAVTATQKSIESYKSLKQSLITRAVTKGVRGKREMKDSGVKRWGMIPNDWKFVRLKYCITNVSSGLSAVTDDDTSGESGKFVLRTSAVSTGIFIPSEVKAVLKSAEVRLKCPVEGNTLIVSRMNTSNMVGSCAYVDRDYENIFLPDKLWKIHLKKEYNVKFFWYAINSIPARAYYSEISTGASASMQNITMADFGNNKIALPPIDEQDCIASYLDEKCTAIDTLIAKKEQLLTELEAYKKSLIYEYVTGKREIITNLLTMQYS